jgi:hypothetical protein
VYIIIIIPAERGKLSGFDMTLSKPHYKSQEGGGGGGAIKCSSDIPVTNNLCKIWLSMINHLSNNCCCSEVIQLQDRGKIDGGTDVIENTLPIDTGNNIISPAQ